MFIYFFFQAEDGIRDLYVTGVQTCALPILPFARGESKKLTMANAVGRLSIKMNVVLSGFMTELSRFKGILVCVLIGIPMTGIALAQDSVQARGNESQTKPGVANLLDTRGSAPPPTSSQP